MLQHDRRNGRDLFSVALEFALGCAQAPERNLSNLIAKVRRLDYSITDLFAEFSCLDDALDEVLRGSREVRQADVESFLRRVRDQIKLLFGMVLDQTAAVYETVTETVRCGYCQADDGGAIVFANAEMDRLLGVPAEGVDLPGLFGPERDFVRSAIRGDYGQHPGVRRLKLKRPDGRTIAVNVSPAPLLVDGVKRGGYAVLTDVSKIVESDTQIFDRQPLGIVRYSGHQITYANSRAAEIFGREAARLVGMSIWDLVPDAKNRRIVGKQLKKRMAGVSEEYEAEVTRLDNGRRLPVLIAGSPEFDDRDRPIGGFVILRSTELEHKAAAIHTEIETSRNAKKLLRKVAGIVGKVVPFDDLWVSVFSRDMQHAAALYIHGGEDRWQTRWYPISEGLAEWMMQPPNPQPVDDLCEFIKRPEMEELRNGRDMQMAIDEGFRSFIRYSIVREGKVVACFSLGSKRIAAYSQEDCGRLAALPIEKAAHMALYHRDRAEQEFRHRLLRGLGACRSSAAVARLVVRLLSGHYGWENVALFAIDEANQQFTLKAQKAPAKSTYRLPRGFSQALNAGVLGHVYGTGEGVNIGDVGSGKGPASKFIRYNNWTTSELCLPIRIGNRVRFLLNLEHNKENAFSQEEQDALESIVKDIELMLDHLFTQYILNEVITSANDLIAITNQEGHIERLNPAGTRLLGVAKDDARGRAFHEFFSDRLVADYAAGLREVTDVEVDLVNPREQPLKALLSSQLLPGEFDRKVFFARDLSALKRLEELEMIGTLFQEIATQTRAPLALVSGFMLRLQRRLPPEMAEGVTNALKHLRKVEITHERLLLLDPQAPSPRFDRVELDIRRVIRSALSELTDDEQRVIEPCFSDSLPLVKGDFYQLWFVFQTLFAYLLRYLPNDKRIKLHVEEAEGAIDIRITGFAPASASGAPDGIARTRAEVALGVTVLRRFVEQHGGTYCQKTAANSAAEFHIRLPASPEGKGMDDATPHSPRVA